MATRIIVANPTVADDITEIVVSGNSFVIEEAPADTYDVRNLIFIDTRNDVDSAGIPLISRLKYERRGDRQGDLFKRLYIKCVGGSVGDVSILTYDARAEDITLPDA